MHTCTHALAHAHAHAHAHTVAVKHTRTVVHWACVGAYANLYSNRKDVIRWDEKQEEFEGATGRHCNLLSKSRSLSLCRSFSAALMNSSSSTCTPRRPTVFLLLRDQQDYQAHPAASAFTLLKDSNTHSNSVEKARH